MNPSGWLAGTEHPGLGVETSPRLSLLLFGPAFVSGSSPASKALLQANQVCQKGREEEAEFRLGNPLADQLPKDKIGIIHTMKIYCGRNISSG